MTNLELYKQVLEEVKASAETNSALVLGPGAVHNLWLAIQSIGLAAEPSPDPDDAPEATAKFAEVVQDAARYRWLREKGPAIRQQITASGFAHEVDARIDKARTAENRPAEPT